MKFFLLLIIYEINFIIYEILENMKSCETVLLCMYIIFRLFRMVLLIYNFIYRYRKR